MQLRNAITCRSIRTARAVAAFRHRRLVVGGAFALIGVVACVLLGQRLTHSSWPLAHTRPLFVASAAVCYFASFVLRAFAWQMLFPRAQRPNQARCLASVGAAAASGAVLPFRLDYLIKVGTLRKLGGIRIGLEAIVLSIVSLGLIDGIAMLPMAISATATTSSDLRAPMLIVVAFGLGCCALLATGGRLVRVPLLRRSRRLVTLAGHVSEHGARGGRRRALVAWLYLSGCWTARALAGVSLLAALGLRFSPTLALCVLCLGAAAGVVPITSGGAVANLGASAGILLLLGVGKDVAINFSLASGLLVVTSAVAAGASGALMTLALRVARRAGPAPAVS